MLPGVAQMAREQALPVGNPAKTMNMMQPSTHDYFLKGREDAAGSSSLPGMVQQTVNELGQNYRNNSPNQIFPVPTGPGGQMIMPTGGPTAAGVMPSGTMTGIGGLLGEILFNR